MYQIITLFTLNLHNSTCQLYLNKARIFYFLLREVVRKMVYLKVTECDGYKHKPWYQADMGLYINSTTYNQKINLRGHKD